MRAPARTRALIGSAFLAGVLALPAVAFAALAVGMAGLRADGPPWVTWTLRVGMVSLFGGIALALFQAAIELIRPPRPRSPPAEIRKICPACGIDRTEPLCPACGHSADPSGWIRDGSRGGAGLLMPAIGLGITSFGLVIVGAPFQEPWPGGWVFVSVEAVGALLLVVGCGMTVATALEMVATLRSAVRWRYEAEDPDADVAAAGWRTRNGWHAQGERIREHELHPESHPAEGGAAPPSLISGAVARLVGERLVYLAISRVDAWERAPGSGLVRRVDERVTLGAGTREARPDLLPLCRLLHRHIRVARGGVRGLREVLHDLARDPDAAPIFERAADLPFDAAARRIAFWLESLPIDAPGARPPG